MSEFMSHALGICGEHHHPNVINLTALFITMGMLFLSLKFRPRSNRGTR